MMRGDTRWKPTTAFSIDCDPPWLSVRFRERQQVLSWAVHRPGLQVAERVVWLQVKNADLPPSVDPGDLLHSRMQERGFGDAIGLMTSGSLEHHESGSVVRDAVRATCLMTLGLSNAERIGKRRSLGVFDRADAAAVGTINALCHVSAPLSEPAMLEALSVATQARTTAILAQSYENVPGAGPVTGTGTDCIVIACPNAGAGEKYAGLHTAVGEALGAAVLEVTGKAMRGWLARNHCPSPAKPE